MGRELFIKNQSEWEYSRTVIDKLISDREVDLSAPRPETESVSTAQYDEQEELLDDETEYETDDSLFENTDNKNNAENLDLSASEIIENSENSEDAPEQTQTEQQEPLSRSVEFSDTTAIMDELFRARLSDENGASYAEKLVSEKYVSDRTDNSFSAEMYFRDFFDENEEAEQEEAENEATQFPPPALQDEEQFREQYGNAEYTTPVEENVAQDEQKSENIFLDYHTPSMAKPYESGIIEREYRNILGDFLNSSFVERPSPTPPPEEPQQESTAPIVQDVYVQNQITPAPLQETVAPSDAEQNPEIENYAEPQPENQTEQNEPTYNNEATEQYTSDADVNRKLNRITGEVREMGDNVVIRPHNNNSSKEYNNAYYYLSNKLMIVHYGILFGIMMLEILFSAIFVNVVLHAGRSSDKWFYIIAVLIAVTFPIVAFVKNFTAPDKRKRINFSLKNSLIYRLIVMAQCFLIIYCANVIGGMELGFELKYITTLLLPALLSVCFPISALIFNALFKSKKFAIEQ